MFFRKRSSLNKIFKYFNDVNYPYTMMKLTDNEEKLLKAMQGKLTVKDAALAIGISTRTAYNVLYRIRRKYLKAREFVNKILAYRRSDKLIDYVLSPRVPLWKEIKELEEEEKEREF